MAASEDYFRFVSERLSHIDGIAYRKMMGEYIIYYNDKIVGGIYDNRLLIKITDASKRLMPEAHEELPYDGAKPMLLAEGFESCGFTERLFNEMYSELPMPKKRK